MGEPAIIQSLEIVSLNWIKPANLDVITWRTFFYINWPVFK